MARRRRKTEFTYHGEFIDLHQLGFGMDDRRYSLDAACKQYGVTHGKIPVKEHGQITSTYIAYNRRDTQATEELFCSMLTEFLKHPINLAPGEAYSPASLAKASLRAMGVPPILERQPLFSRRILGYGMNAFYGGRAECRIRRTVVPVVHMDFTSMYPTAFSLLGLWDLLTCAHIDTVYDTAAVRQLLERSDLLDYCLTPEAWRKMGCCLVQIRPRGEILPVRARYGATRTWNIGVNPLTSDEPLWFALPDVIAATLLTGRPPEILRAVRLVPRGTTATLRPVRFRGVVPIDPRTQNSFKVAIEERKRLSRRASLAAEERERLDLALKITANAGTYGIFAEFNRHVLPVEITERVKFYSRDGEKQMIPVGAPEEPGKFGFPPIAATITAGARLMLALLERLVTDLGGTYAFCDTDSMAVVATAPGGWIPCPGGAGRLAECQEAVWALSWGDVEQIRARFEQLNPYDRDAVPGSSLRLEKVNFDPATEARRQVYCYAISAKRYALCTQRPNGSLALADWTEHGLGVYVNPTDPDDSDRDWIRIVWEGLLAQDVFGKSYPWPVWVRRPAASRITVSTPSLLRPFKLMNARKPYPDQIKPFNFLITVHVAPFGHPPGTDPTRFHLIAPWMSNGQAWTKMKWLNRYSTSGETYTITTSGATGREGIARVKTMADVIADYLVHPEPKSLDQHGVPCREATKGLLQRRPVGATHIHDIGKESNDLEEREAGLVHDLDEVVTEYANVTSNPFRTLVLPVLRDRSVREIARRIGLDATTMKRIRGGRTRPRRAHRQALIALAASWARSSLRKWRIDCPEDDLSACFAYLKAREQRGVRACRMCQKAVTQLRARYCSAACRHRAYRRRKSLRQG